MPQLSGNPIRVGRRGKLGSNPIPVRVHSFSDLQSKTFEEQQKEISDRSFVSGVFAKSVDLIPGVKEFSQKRFNEQILEGEVDFDTLDPNTLSNILRAKDVSPEIREKATRALMARESFGPSFKERIGTNLLDVAEKSVPFAGAGETFKHTKEEVAQGFKDSPVLGKALPNVSALAASAFTIANPIITPVAKGEDALETLAARAGTLSNEGRTPQEVEDFIQERLQGLNNELFPKADLGGSESVTSNTFRILGEMALEDKANTLLLLEAGRTQLPILKNFAVRTKNKIAPSDAFIRSTLERQVEALKKQRLGSSQETTGFRGSNIVEQQATPLQRQRLRPETIETEVAPELRVAVESEIASERGQAGRKQMTKTMKALADEELVSAMDIANRERILKGETPKPTRANGKPDFAAEEFLRRSSEIVEEGFREPEVQSLQELARPVVPVRSRPPFEVKAEGGILPRPFEQPFREPLKRSQVGAEASRTGSITDSIANAARQRIRGKIGANPFLDPALLRDHLIVAANLFERGARSLSQFTKQMLERMGEAIRPYIRRLYAETRRMLADESGAINPKADVLKAIEKTVGIQRARTTGRRLSQRESQLGQALKGRESQAGKVQKLETKIEAQKEGFKEQEVGFEIGRRRELLSERQKGREKVVAERIRQQDIAVRKVEKINEQHSRIVDRFKRGQKVQLEAARFVREHLPNKLQGNLISRIVRAKNDKQFFKLMDEVRSRATEFQKREIIKAIRKDLKKTKASTVDVGFRLLAKKINAALTTKGRTFNQQKRYESVQRDVNRLLADGNPIEIPTVLMNEILFLEGKPLLKMSFKDLKFLRDRIDLINEAGRLKQAIKQRIFENEVQGIIDAIAESGVVPRRMSAALRKAGISSKLTVLDQLKNYVAKAQNGATTLGDAVSPMDVLMDLLDGGKATYDGPVYTHFKYRMDRAYQIESNALDPKLKSFRELTRELKLTDENFNRIGIWAAAKQAGGRNKLQQLIDEGLVSKAEVEGIITKGLNASETRMYNFMRKELDLIRPQIERTMAEVYNQPLKFVENYFPWMTDFESSANLLTQDRMAIAQEPFTPKSALAQGRRTNARKGFTEARISDGKGRQLIQLNASNVFVRHLSDAYHLVHSGAELKKLGKVANSDFFKRAVGDTGQRIVQDWIDTIARRGGSIHSKPIPWLDMIRTNVSAAQLALRLTSTAFQTLAFVDAMAVNGPIWQMKGAYAMLNPEMRKLVNQSAELRNRGGGELSILELERRNSTLAKAQRLGFSPLLFLDRMAAEATFLGAYLKALNKKGSKFRPGIVDEAALLEANRVVRRTQGSALAKDLPQALAFGKGIGNVSVARAFFQFQTFLLNRWSLFRHEVLRAGFKNPRVAVQVMAFIALADLGAVLIRHGYRELMDELFDVNENETDFAQELIKEKLSQVPYASGLVSSIYYGGDPISSTPVFSPFLDVVTGGVQITKGSAKGDEAQVKRGLVNVGGGVAAFVGVPGSGQTSDILRKQIRANQ